MKCYFECSNESQGICQVCGSFACRSHSTIKAGKFTCCFCSGTDIKMTEDITISIIKEEWVNQPKCELASCNNKLYSGELYFDSIGHHIWSNVLQKNFKEKISRSFPYDTPINQSNSENICPNKHNICSSHNTISILKRAKKSTFF